MCNDVVQKEQSYKGQTIAAATSSGLTNSRADGLTFTTTWWNAFAGYLNNGRAFYRPAFCRCYAIYLWMAWLVVLRMRITIILTITDKYRMTLCTFAFP